MSVLETVLSHLKPHSTRAAATSKAKTASVPIQEILKTAGWSSSRCFDKFYDKPVESSTFASAVLQIDYSPEIGLVGKVLFTKYLTERDVTLYLCFLTLLRCYVHLHMVCYGLIDT